MAHGEIRGLPLTKQYIYMKHCYFINGGSVSYDDYVSKAEELSRKKISHSYEKRKCYEEDAIIHDLVYGDWKLQPVRTRG